MIPDDHLFAVGFETPKEDGDDPNEEEELVLKLVEGSIRCDSWEQLLSACETKRQRGIRLSRIDLFDDGAPGFFQFGDEIVLNDTGTGIDRFRQLGDYLAENGVIRLLSCRVGEGQQGRLLLLSLKRVLGHSHEVYAATHYINSTYFDAAGFNVDLERTHLASSKSLARGAVINFF